MGGIALDIEHLPDELAILCNVHFNHLIVLGYPDIPFCYF